MGIIWPPTWLEFDQAQIFAQLEPSFPPLGHLRQLKPSCFVIDICLYAVVFRQLNGFLQAGSTWRYRLATRRCKFDFEIWLELAVPFGQGFRKKVQIYESTKRMSEQNLALAQPQRWRRGCVGEAGGAATRRTLHFNTPQDSYPPPPPPPTPHTPHSTPFKRLSVWATAKRETLCVASSSSSVTQGDGRFINHQLTYRFLAWKVIALLSSARWESLGTNEGGDVVVVRFQRLPGFDKRFTDVSERRPLRGRLCAQGRDDLRNGRLRWKHPGDVVY